MQFRKTIYIFLAIALVGAGVWYFQISYHEALGLPASPKLSTALAADKTQGGSGVAAAGTRSGVEFKGQAGNNNRLGLFDEPVRSLMRSDQMGKVDYARLRVNTQCLAFMSGLPGTDLVEQSIEREAKLGGKDKLLFGHAALATRQAAALRSIEACSKLFEGSMITADEMKAYNTQPNTSKWRTLAKAGQKQYFGNDPEATLEFFDKIVLEPMLGSMEAFLYVALSRSGELSKDYPAEQADALRTLAVPFLLCQMGDDCATGGIVNEQLCWQSGICGGNVQDAILEHLRSQQINTVAFEQFVTTLRQKLEIGPVYLKQLAATFGK